MNMTSAATIRVYDIFRKNNFSEDEAREIVDFMDAVGKEGLATKEDLFGIRQDISNVKTELKQEISDVRIELKQEISDVKSELKQEISDVKSELKQEISDVKSELKNEISSVRTELKQDISNARLDMSKLDKKFTVLFVVVIILVALSNPAVLSLMGRVFPFVK